MCLDFEDSHVQHPVSISCVCHYKLHLNYTKTGIALLIISRCRSFVTKAEARAVLQHTPKQLDSVQGKGRGGKGRNKNKQQKQNKPTHKTVIKKKKETRASMQTWTMHRWTSSRPRYMHVQAHDHVRACTYLHTYATHCMHAQE